MTLFADLILGKRASVLATHHPTSNPATWWPRGEESATGLQITERNSLGHSAVYQAVQLIAGLHSILPCHVLERSGESREKATTHPLWRLLHEEPNPESSWSQFDQAQMLNKLTFGNRYAEVEYTGNARVGMRLWHIPSDRVTPRRVYKRPGGGVTMEPGQATPEDRRNGGVVLYEVKPDGGGQPVYVEAQRMIHVPDLSFDGLVGFSRVRTILESIAVGRARGLAMAALYGNDSTPGGVLERPAEAPALSPQGERNLIMAWEATHGGVARKGRTAVLQEGTAFKPLSFSPRDAMMIEAGQFSILEVAHAFNISPHWLGHSVGSQPYANIESEWTALAVRTILPHAKADEMEFRRKLLFPAERERYVIEYDFKGLMRGDSSSRAAFYTAMQALGVMTPNDIARAENMPAIPADQGGDDYAGSKPAAPPPMPPPRFPPPPPPADDDEEDDDDEDERAVVRAAVTRAVTREAGLVTRACERATSVADLRDLLDAAYRDLGEYLTKAGLSERRATRHREQIDRLVADEPVLSIAREKVEAQVREWVQLTAAEAA